MTNKLCEKYDITIFTIYRGGELEKELNPKVKIISLYDNQNKILPLYLLIFGKHVYNKNIRNKFDVEIAFLEGPITRIFSHRDNSEKIAWIHNDIKSVFGKGIKADLKKKIDKKIYKKYDTIVFVSEENKKSFNELYGIANANETDSNEKVIYNYIDKDRVLGMSNEDYDVTMDMEIQEDVPTILTVSRLVNQKGLDRFIRVHKKIIDDGILHKVYVIGDGEERGNLQKLIKELNVESSFILLGKKENPYPYMKKCDYFALLSYYEGYGMVIEEAKIFDKTIIITDTATKEAVRDYKKCVIVRNNGDDIYYELKRILRG